MKYSEPDEERQDLRLMIIQNTPAKQATDWLTAFHQVRCGTLSATSAIQFDVLDNLFSS